MPQPALHDVTATEGNHPMDTDFGTLEQSKQLYRIPEAMLLLSMSRSVLYEQLRSGRLRSVKQGRARLIPASAITEYVNLLESEAEVSYDETA
jgi:excisionase family DNA binding protein